MITHCCRRCASSLGLVFVVVVVVAAVAVAAVAAAAAAASFLTPVSYNSKTNGSVRCQLVENVGNVRSVRTNINIIHSDDNVLRQQLLFCLSKCSVRTSMNIDNEHDSWLTLRIIFSFFRHT